MIIEKEIGNDHLATVYIARIGKHHIEFVESIQPPLPREEKWVLVLSCLIGCPVKCLMCDAGQECHGVLSKEQIFEQIDHMIIKRYPNRVVPVKKFKIQFTRMGEPVFNPAVLDVLEELPMRYEAPGLLPSFSTVAPQNDRGYLARLTEIKNRLYNNGRFQMQFSLHTTNEAKRDQLIPIRKKSFDDIAEFGKQFFREGDRKITLNFIVMEEYPIEPHILQKHFDPAHFVIKLTPLNPTYAARSNKLEAKYDSYGMESSLSQLIEELAKQGFESIVSIGEMEENAIGSNCGQYIMMNKPMCDLYIKDCKKACKSPETDLW
jgi:23S rRNA (adenine2503-C2)-methyltransferase